MHSLLSLASVHTNFNPAAALHSHKCVSKHFTPQHGPDAQTSRADVPTSSIRRRSSHDKVFMWPYLVIRKTQGNLRRSRLPFEWHAVFVRELPGICTTSHKIFRAIAYEQISAGAPLPLQRVLSSSKPCQTHPLRHTKNLQPRYARWSFSLSLSPSEPYSTKSPSAPFVGCINCCLVPGLSEKARRSIKCPRD